MSELDFVFVNRERRESFYFLLEGVGDEPSEIVITFKDGELELVSHPYKLHAPQGERINWKLAALINQMIENAERRMRDEALPQVSVGGDAAAVSYEWDIEDKKNLPKGTFPDTSTRQGLTEQLVIKLRRKFRDPKHKDLVLAAEGRRIGMTGTAIKAALVGETWPQVTEEPPLTQAELNHKLAYPKKYA